MRKNSLILILAVLTLVSGCYGSPEGGTVNLRFPVSDIDQLSTRTGVEIDREISSDGNGSLMLQTELLETVELFEIENPGLNNTRVVYRAMIRTEGLTGDGDMRGIAYLEMKALFPGGEELVSHGPRIPPTGTTDWTPVETVLYVDKGVNPEKVLLSLVVDGKGKVWIDDVALDSRPLRIDYLFWGHAVVWIILILYIYNLIGKQRRIRKELASLKTGA